jgi:predicted RNA-binding protein YlqC (UPF0109 family)
VVQFQSPDEVFLRHLLCAIVLQPEHMRLVRSEDSRGILFRLSLAKSDMPLLIRKAGQSIGAVRRIMKMYRKGHARLLPDAPLRSGQRDSLTGILWKDERQVRELTPKNAMTREIRASNCSSCRYRIRAASPRAEPAGLVLQALLLPWSCVDARLPFSESSRRAAGWTVRPPSWRLLFA